MINQALLNCTFYETFGVLFELDLEPLSAAVVALVAVVVVSVAVDVVVSVAVSVAVGHLQL